jgi:hypothetical protein
LKGSLLASYSNGSADERLFPLEAEAEKVLEVSELRFAIIAMMIIKSKTKKST